MRKQDESTDVIVIGGGIVGASIAYRAACSGLSVTLVERGRCGCGASWAGAGIIDPGSEARTDPLALLRKASVARYPDFVAELRERSGIDRESQQDELQADNDSCALGSGDGSCAR